MNERKVDKVTNDIFFDEEKGCIARTLSYVESSAQKIKLLLQTFKGESFVNRNAGLDWFGNILGMGIIAVDEIKSEIEETIRRVDCVKNVMNVDVDVIGRNVKFSYKVELKDGNVIEDVVE